MRPFVFKQADAIWPTGATLLHVYVVPDLGRERELAALIDGCRTATEDFPLTHVEGRWLHITLDQITDRVGREISAPERNDLVSELRNRLSHVEPFQIMAGSPLSYHSGVIFDLYPDGPLVELHRAVRGAIRTVRGADAVRYPWGVQHLTLAYANAEASSDDVQRLLRRVRPSHAPLRVDAVELVDVRADAEAKTITWDDVAKIPLGSG